MTPELREMLSAIAALIADVRTGEDQATLEDSTDRLDKAYNNFLGVATLE